MGAGWQKWWKDSAAAALSQRQLEQHYLANPGLAVLEDFLAEHGRLDLLTSHERGLLHEVAAYKEALESSVQVAIGPLEEHDDNYPLGRAHRITVNYRGLRRTVSQVSAPYGVARALRALASDIERAFESLQSGLTSPLPPGRNWFNIGIDRAAIREGEAIAFTPPRPMRGLLPRLDAMPPVGQSPDNPLRVGPGDTIPPGVRYVQGTVLHAESNSGAMPFSVVVEPPIAEVNPALWGGPPGRVEVPLDPLPRTGDQLIADMTMAARDALRRRDERTVVSPSLSALVENVQRELIDPLVDRTFDLLARPFPAGRPPTNWPGFDWRRFNEGPPPASNALLTPTRPGDPHFVREAPIDHEAVARAGRRAFAEATKPEPRKKQWGGFGEGRRADASRKKKRRK